MNDSNNKPMTATLPEIKQSFQKFENNYKEYFDYQKSRLGPEEMYFQCADRSEILGTVFELCYNFGRSADMILKAFEDYKQKRPKTSGRDGRLDCFETFINNMIDLLNQKEEIGKWGFELTREQKLLEDQKVNEMSAEDLK